MIQLGPLQMLLMFSALGWAIWPVWGGLAFSVSVAMLAVGTLVRGRQARAVLERHEALLNALSDEPRALLRRFPWAYVWPRNARAWANTWLVVPLLALLVSAVMLVRALLTQQWWLLTALATVPVGVVLAGAVSRVLKPRPRFKADLTALAPAHQTLRLYLKLKETVGHWPPHPAPDPGAVVTDDEED